MHLHIHTYTYTKAAQVSSKANTHANTYTFPPTGTQLFVHHIMAFTAHLIKLLAVTF
jgi:hypothetical protein